MRVEDGGRTGGAALRTLPLPMILARPEVPGVLRALADHLVRSDHRLSGVMGAVPEADEFAEFYGAPTPSGLRIGPVYTPPEQRGKGYATSLTAAVSADILAGGTRFCFLYTDMANPTSNRIYRRIGYRLVCGSARVMFEPAGA